MKKWTVLIILAIAQFVMVLDSTVMNVSMSTVAADLGTTINGLQIAITFYTLTMASLMLTGGKLGDIFGKLTAFKIGALVYSIGSLITAFSSNLTVLIAGWSVIEGLGAVLVIPAIAALAAANYSGKDRVKAFAAIGGISGAAAAAGPLIGGFMTTYLSWRYVFAAETVIMIILLVFVRKIHQKNTAKVPFSSLDIKSVFASALGMILIVYGMLQSKIWGWVVPMAKPVVAGHEIAPLGISIVAYLILAGSFVLWGFYNYQKRLEAKADKVPLLKVSMLSNIRLRAGLTVLMFQYVITASVFFVIPIYLQMVLGLDALATGIKILPLSVGLILASVAGSKAVTKFSPKKIIRGGQLLLIIGSVTLLASINVDLRGFMFGLAMFVVGAGLGLLASQIGNVTMSSVTSDETSEVGGLQGTAQNLGASFGTALVGSILIASLTTGFVSSINASDEIPQQVKTYIDENTQSGVAVVSAQQVEDYAISQNVPQAEAEDIAGIYKTSQLKSLKESAFFIVILALVSLVFSRNIPNKKL